MAVSGHVGDAAGYKRALEKLEERNEETLLDRLGLWRVLASTGSKSEAKELALAYSDPPVSALEALRLASVFISLDMTRSCAGFFGAVHTRVWLRRPALVDLRRPAYRQQTVGRFAHAGPPDAQGRQPAGYAGWLQLLSGRPSRARARPSLPSQRSVRQSKPLAFRKRKPGIARRHQPDPFRFSSGRP